MNGEDLKFLADRADDVTGRAEHRLAEVHERIRSVRHRRATEAVAGVSTAALALVAGIAVLTGPIGTNQHTKPIPPANSNTKSHAPSAATAREIVYRDGWSSRTIHVGDRTVDLSAQVPTDADVPLYLNTTDDGVVFTFDAGQQRIWFTDGRDVAAIGQVGGYTHIGPSPVATGTSGSLAAWPDSSAGSTEIVIYDTAGLAEVTRIECPKCTVPTAGVGWIQVVGSHVYWDEDASGTDDATKVYDARSNTVRPASQQIYLDDLAKQPRGLLVGSTGSAAAPTNGIGVSFAPVDGRLVPLRESGEGRTSETTTTAVDTASGTELDLRLPDEYLSSQILTVFDWLDDDRLALVADGDRGTDQGQILVCRISAQHCWLAVPGGAERRWVANIAFP